MAGGHFSAELFRFLTELGKNNNRAWFDANKTRYVEHVKEPLLGFISDFAAELERINPNFVADPRPLGGSMFRIHRDTRFARDKTPYKTNAGAHFRHRASRGDVHGTGFYLHLEPGNCFAGCGIWHPQPPTLAQIRDAIVAKPRDWAALLARGIELEGDLLARAPRGYPADHPHATDLRRKDFYTLVQVSERQVLGARFASELATVYRAVAPLNAFLTRALGLAW